MPECGKCRKWKPLADFQVYTAKQRTKTGRILRQKVSGYCKACKKEYQRARYTKKARRTITKSTGFTPPILNARLTCGCEPGWRCVQHAKMKYDGKPDKVSESVVMRVYNTTRQ